jgi:hypothetical protein
MVEIYSIASPTRNFQQQAFHHSLEQFLSMNSTSDIVGWVPEPNVRGTVGLLWSCLATVVLCTWSAIHPNLPGTNDSKWMTLRRRIGYVILCLVAPELCVCNALDELLQAGKTRLRVSQTLQKLTES